MPEPKIVDKYRTCDVNRDDVNRSSSAGAGGKTTYLLPSPYYFSSIGYLIGLYIHPRPELTKE